MKARNDSGNDSGNPVAIAGNHRGNTSARAVPASAITPPNRSTQVSSVVSGKENSQRGSAAPVVSANSPRPDPNSQALALVQSLPPIASLASSRTRAIKTSPRDLKAWSLARAGKNEEEISAILDCSLLEAQQGIITVNSWLASVSNDIVNAQANEEVIEGIKGAGKALQEARQAERVISPPIYDKETGEKIAEAFTVPDHATRLEAVKISAEFAAKFKPVSGGPTINIGNSVNVNNNGGGDKAKSFEQRVRELREKRGLRNDDIQIQDATIEDEGEGDDEDDEEDDEAEYMDDGAEDDGDDQ